MTGATARPAIAADVDGVRDVAAHGWTAAYGLPPAVDYRRRDGEVARPRGAARVTGDDAFFLADDDRVIGYVSGAPVDDDPDETVLGVIYVDPDQRGEGIGSRLLRRFET